MQCGVRIRRCSMRKTADRHMNYAPRPMIKKARFIKDKCPVCRHVLYIDVWDYFTADHRHYYSAWRCVPQPAQVRSTGWYGTQTRKPANSQQAQYTYSLGEDRCPHCRSWLGITQWHLNGVNFCDIAELDDADKRHSNAQDRRVDYEYWYPKIEAP